MKYLLLLVTVSLLFSSCNKDLDIESFWHCNSAQPADSATIANKLTGSWKWTKQSCFWSDKTTKANKHVVASFYANGTFTVMENSSTITQGNWRLKNVDINVWGLDLSSPNEYLYGRILFCNNQVLFNDSHIDGCDNLFEKEN